MDNEKEIRWVGSSYEDLLAFPKDCRKQAGFQLGKIQAGLEPADRQAGQDHCRGTLPRSGKLQMSDEKDKQMKIDTEIRHVTKPGVNLFLELGFAPNEAKRLQAASRKQINDTRLLKQQLMEELSTWIIEHHLKQAEAAKILMVSRPRVSDVVNKKTAKFTIDTLVEMLSRVGKPVRLAIG